MKPIKCEPISPINKIKDYKLLEQGYLLRVSYTYLPEFLEGVYPKDNTNSILLEYINKRDEYKYIGTYKEEYDGIYLEYYMSQNEELITYLITVPKNEDKKKYYPSLQLVCIFEKEYLVS